jgi:hypothetical protein
MTYILEYLDAVDSNTDFILESDTDAIREEEVRGRRGSPQIKPKIVTSYNKFMGSINSSGIVLYTYLDERWTVRYWKKVTYNTVARMMLNTYILCKENYRGPGRLKSRYNYTVIHN